MTEVIWTITKLEPDSLNYILEERITDTVRSGSGQNIFTIERWKATLDSQGSQEELKLDSVWTSYRSEIQAVLNENNLPIMKLVFPIVEGKVWDANGLNSNDSDEFQMEMIGQPYANELGQYEKALKVVQEFKPDSIISLDIRHEIFAEGIGLVEKVASQLSYCQDVDCFGDQVVEEGRVFVQKLVSFTE